jgi:hypothetical protein
MNLGLKMAILNAEEAVAMLTDAVAGTANADPSSDCDELLALHEQNYEKLLALYDRQQAELERTYRDYAALLASYERLILATWTPSGSVH